MRRVRSPRHAGCTASPPRCVTRLEAVRFVIVLPPTRTSRYNRGHPRIFSRQVPSLTVPKSAGPHHSRPHPWPCRNRASGLSTKAARKSFQARIFSVFPATKDHSTMSSQDFVKRSHAEQPARSALLVLGMHRSGTSAITGALRLCGAWVGEKAELTVPNIENPISMHMKHGSSRSRGSAFCCRSCASASRIPCAFISSATPLKLPNLCRYAMGSASPVRSLCGKRTTATP